MWRIWLLTFCLVILTTAGVEADSSFGELRPLTEPVSPDCPLHLSDLVRMVLPDLQQYGNNFAGANLAPHTRYHVVLQQDTWLVDAQETFGVRDWYRS